MATRNVTVVVVVVVVVVEVVITGSEINIVIKCLLLNFDPDFKDKNLNNIKTLNNANKIFLGKLHNK